MDEMKVDSNGLLTSADELRQKVQSMQAILDDTTSIVNGTAGSWHSAAAEALRDRYTSLASKFTDFYDAITKYSNFLENTANAYIAADKTINQKAEELLNEGYNA